MFFDEPKNHNSLKLKAMIDRACDPHQFEPNFALNLDICDFINEKQLGYPMEAAMYIAKLSNSRNQNEALLALTLLDLCAKNCGYSFHLAISTKEFLNSLVRRFPEHPMVSYFFLLWIDVPSFAGRSYCQAARSSVPNSNQL